MQGSDHASPYLALFCLASDGAGAGELRQGRKNLVRTSILETVQ